MSENEYAVNLPSGGVAFIAPRLTHGQAMAFSRHRLRITLLAPDGTPKDGLSDEQRDELDSLVADVGGLYIRTCTSRSEGVRSPTGVAIELPSSVDLLDAGDADFLYGVIQAAIQVARNWGDVERLIAGAEAAWAEGTAGEYLARATAESEAEGNGRPRTSRPTDTTTTSRRPRTRR